VTRARKLFIGRTLREVRLRERLTQAAFARRLGTSPSYLNQMENDQRPVSAAVLVGLADGFDVDIGALATSDGDRVLTDLIEAFADPFFGEQTPEPAELAMVARNAPVVARALLSAHRTLRRAEERLAGLDDTLERAGVRLESNPWDEVRDFFHYLDNHVDVLDRAAETLADTLGIDDDAQRKDERGDVIARFVEHLRVHHGVRTVIAPRREALTHERRLRRYDAEAATLTLDPVSPMPTRAFQLACQIALLEQGETIERIAADAGLRAADAEAVCRVGLANYFAGALLMPYERFRAAACELRHDLLQLADRFGTSEEQVAQRLSTLQRAGAAGTPFFFARVDRAGNITKRHSAAPLKFARYGSACPLWNVHRAFETPERIVRQLAETPDGVRYLCIAWTVVKRSGGFTEPVRRYAMALGCEIRHAADVVYADGLDTGQHGRFEPIGVSCRTCERPDCHQRAVPPIERTLLVDENGRGVLPYRLGPAR